MIDLHLHTTASDGRCEPRELVKRAFAAGITVMSITDHDTRAGERAARDAAATLGIELIPGIEITSVHNGKDVHVLAYGLPDDAPDLERAIAAQRQLRVERAREIGDRLMKLGVPIDVDRLLRAASGSGKALARPQLAQSLIAAGHVSSIAEAFDRYLGEGQPAYVPHQGMSPAETVALVNRSGGIASLAHPARLKDAEPVAATLADAGLGAIEVFHSSHDETARERCLDIARRFDLAVTGGSDFHGDGTRYAELFGRIGLPRIEFERFRTRLEASSRAMTVATHG